VGDPINESDIPSLLEKDITLAGPRDSKTKEKMSGTVKYVEASKNPHVVYMQEYGNTWLSRADFRMYSEAELND
jgi:hypothetical protein